MFLELLFNFFVATKQPKVVFFVCFFLPFLLLKANLLRCTSAQRVALLEYVSYFLLLSINQSTQITALYKKVASLRRGFSRGAGLFQMLQKDLTSKTIHKKSVVDFFVDTEFTNEFAVSVQYIAKGQIYFKEINYTLFFRYTVLIFL